MVRERESCQTLFQRPSLGRFLQRRVGRAQGTLGWGGLENTRREFGWNLFWAEHACVFLSPRTQGCVASSPPNNPPSQRPVSSEGSVLVARVLLRDSLKAGESHTGPTPRLRGAPVAPRRHTTVVGRVVNLAGRLENGTAKATLRRFSPQVSTARSREKARGNRSRAPAQPAAMPRSAASPFRFAVVAATGLLAAAGALAGEVQVRRARTS